MNLIQLKLSIICFLLTFSQLHVNADSPITSTFIYLYYSEYDIVNYSAEKGEMDDKIAMYLADAKNLLDVKIAIINALSWDYAGKANADYFIKYLSANLGLSSENLHLNSLTADNLLCIGYLKALDNYWEMDDALTYTELAKSKKPNSMTVQLISALIQAQKDFDTNWCAVWSGISSVLQMQNLNRDMKTSAIQDIVNYTILYKEYCTSEY